MEKLTFDIAFSTGKNLGQSIWEIKVLQRLNVENKTKIITTLIQNKSVQLYSCKKSRKKLILIDQNALKISNESGALQHK